MLCPSCTDSRFGSEQTSVKRTQDVCKPETRKDYNRLQSTSNDDINCAACGDIIDSHSITMTYVVTCIIAIAQACQKKLL